MNFIPLVLGFVISLHAADQLIIPDQHINRPFHERNDALSERRFDGWISIDLSSAAEEVRAPLNMHVIEDYVSPLRISCCEHEESTIAASNFIMTMPHEERPLIHRFLLQAREALQNNSTVCRTTILASLATMSSASFLAPTIYLLQTGLRSLSNENVDMAILQVGLGAVAGFASSVMGMQAWKSIKSTWQQRTARARTRTLLALLDVQRAQEE